MSRLIATFKGKDGEEYCLHSDGLGFKLPIYTIQIYDKVSVDVNMHLYAHDNEPGIFLEGKADMFEDFVETEKLDEKKTADDLFRTIIEQNKYIEESNVLKKATEKIIERFECRLIKEHSMFPLNTPIDGGVALFRNKKGEIIASAESVVFGADRTSDIQFNKCVGSITLDDLKDVLFFYDGKSKYVKLSSFRGLECNSEAEDEMFLKYKGTNAIVKNGTEEIDLPDNVFQKYSDDQALIEARSALFANSKKQEPAADFGDLDF